MPVMSILKNALGQSLESPSILLASDSERHGELMHGILQGEGFHTRFAGDYSQLDHFLADHRFDMVLLEVTGIHAVEAAVATALRAKRAREGQFVGYLADPALEASGLAGDGVFPRDAARLPVALRSLFADHRDLF
jgi:PleD family two-component response regulator